MSEVSLMPLHRPGLPYIVGPIIEAMCSQGSQKTVFRRRIFNICHTDRPIDFVLQILLFWNTCIFRQPGFCSQKTILGRAGCAFANAVL